MSTNVCKSVAGAAILFVVGLLGGCIVSDELTTLTIHPDGSAELVKFRSNIHSNEKGAKGEAELQQFVGDFAARSDADFVWLAECGAEIVESRWVRSEAPYGTLLVARMPTAEVLERFCSSKGEHGEAVLEGRFVQDGPRRRLSLMFTPNKSPQPAPADTASPGVRQEMANGLSYSRIAVSEGTIVDARGFTVAGDRQSALLATDEIDRLVREATGEVELFVEWQVDCD